MLSLEQLETKLAFQSLDEQRKRWLRYTHPLGSFGKASCFTNSKHVGGTLCIHLKNPMPDKRFVNVDVIQLRWSETWSNVAFFTVNFVFCSHSDEITSNVGEILMTFAINATCALVTAFLLVLVVTSAEVYATHGQMLQPMTQTFE